MTDTSRARQVTFLIANRIPRRVRWFVGLALLLPALAQAAIWTARRQAVANADLPQLRRPIVIAELSPPDFANRLQRLHREFLTPHIRCQRFGLLTLGLVRTIEPQMDAKIPGLLGSATGTSLVNAYYLAGTDTVFTIDPSPSTIAHEWVHALDDQHSARMSGSRFPMTTDKRMALRAVIEGTAMMALKSPTYVTSFSTDLDENGWIFAYGMGPVYVTRRATTVAAAFQLEPQTSYEVIFQGTVSQHSLPHPLLDSKERVLCVDQVGSLGLLTALRRANIDATTAQTVAHAWRGDRIDVIAGPIGRRVIWTVAVSDSISAHIWRTAVINVPQLHSAQRIDLRMIVGDSLHRSPFDRLDRIH